MTRKGGVKFVHLSARKLLPYVFSCVGNQTSWLNTSPYLVAKRPKWEVVFSKKSKRKSAEKEHSAPSPLEQGGCATGRSCLQPNLILGLQRSARDFIFSSADRRTGVNWQRNRFRADSALNQHYITSQGCKNQKRTRRTPVMAQIKSQHFLLSSKRVVRGFSLF